MPIRHDPFRTLGSRAFLLAVLVSAPVAAGAAADPRRTIERAARDLLARAGGLHPLLIGEMHGSEETPALLASVLRQGGGRPWLLGLEIPRREQARIDVFLRSDGGVRARAELMAGGFWACEAQDGRSSAAMLRLIDAVRALNRNGRDIRIVCFDHLAPAGDGRDRDAHMAAALREALDAARHRRAIALMGNDRTRVGRGAPWNAEQEFLGWRPRDREPLSAEVGVAIGSSWVCNPDCGVYEFGSHRTPGDGVLRVNARADERGYCASPALPRLTASPPAAATAPSRRKSARPL